MKKKDEITTIAQLKEIKKKFVAEREWQTYHNPKNLSISIAIEAAELMEKFQFLTPEESIEVAKINAQEIAHELADIFAYLLSFANQCAIDITSVFEEKMALNAKKYPIDLAKGTHLKYTKLKK